VERRLEGEIQIVVVDRARFASTGGFLPAVS
jgi:hypothetical protein